MLKTNNVAEYGTSVINSWSGAVTTVVESSRDTHFTVAPSPCFNPGNHVDPVPYSYTKNVLNQPNGWYAVRDLGRPTVYTRTGYLGGMFNGLPSLRASSDYSDIRNKALDKLYNDIRNSDISLNTTIGEGRETLDMVMAVAHKAQEFIDKFRKAKKKAKRDIVSALRNPLQTVGGLELLWSVGLSPLINDVENLRNHLAEVRSPNIDIRAQARSQKELNLNAVYTENGANVSEDALQTLRIEYGVIFQITDVHQFENWRLGLTIRPTLVWELTTLSFVVDYFVNIGQYLQLMEASILNNGIVFQRGYVTTTSRFQWFKESVKEFGPERVSNSHNWHSYGYTQSKSRVLLTSFPSPKRPTVKLPTSASQLLNCAALLSQLIAKR